LSYGCGGRCHTNSSGRGGAFNRLPPITRRGFDAAAQDPTNPSPDQPARVGVPTLPELPPRALDRRRCRGRIILAGCRVVPGLHPLHPAAQRAEAGEHAHLGVRRRVREHRPEEVRGRVEQLGEAALPARVDDPRTCSRRYLSVTITGNSDPPATTNLISLPWRTLRRLCGLFRTRPRNTSPA